MIHPTAVIDESVRIYGNKDLLSVGAHSRIDAFAVITIGERGIQIGSRVHVGAGVYLFGSGGRIFLGDCVSLSPRATIYTAMDDMAADVLIGPTIPDEHRKVIKGDVILEQGSAVGTGGIVFPRVRLGIGVIVGAMSIAERNVLPGAVVVGPNQRIVRSRDISLIWNRLQEVKGLCE